MSHHIYQTKAYVIESTEAGEANRRLSLLTEDLGLISVAAQGVRHGVSKLKASIQDLSYSKVSVVRGKEVWRLTNAEKLISLFDRRLPISVRRLLAHCLQFIKRLTPEDVKMEELFTLMSKLSTYCFSDKEEAEKYVKEIRLLFEIRTLSYLGYGSSDSVIEGATVDSDFSLTQIQYAEVHKNTLQKHVDRALTQSHL
jgi:recombinational DNA repair protein (RecF pathway)